MNRAPIGPLDEISRTKIRQATDRLGVLLESLGPTQRDELAQRLADAQHWIATGYPTGPGDGSGSRSADHSSSTERAATTRDQTSIGVARIIEHLDQAITALGDLLYDLAWLRPTTADPNAPMKVAHCIDCTRLISGLPDVRNRDGAIVRHGDPIKAGRCRDCHTLHITRRRTERPIHRDPTTGRLTTVQAPHA